MGSSAAAGQVIATNSINRALMYTLVQDKVFSFPIVATLFL